MPESRSDPPSLSTRLLDLLHALVIGFGDSPLLSIVAFIVVVALIAALQIATGQAVIAFYAFLFSALILLIVFFQRGYRPQVRAAKGAVLPEELQQHYRATNTFEVAQALSGAYKAVIVQTLENAVREVADAVDLKESSVRANIFGVKSDGRMWIVPDFVVNMTHPPETTISMPIGYGSTGRCLEAGKPNIAILRRDWGRDTIEESELAKADSRLRWIISVPVFAGDQSFWVMNVDGLESRDEAVLEQGLSKLYKWSRLISVVLARG